MLAATPDWLLVLLARPSLRTKNRTTTDVLVLQTGTMNLRLWIMIIAGMGNLGLLSSSHLLSQVIIDEYQHYHIVVTVCRQGFTCNSL